MTALELLQSLNLLDETERIEAKRSSESGKSLLESVCAFANEPGLGGGWLLLGVEREEQALYPSYQVEGVPHPDKLCADLATQCRETFNLPVRIELSTEQVNGQAVVVAFVPEAQPQDKPVFFKAQGLPKGALRRVGSVDQHCTDDDLAGGHHAIWHTAGLASLLSHDAGGLHPRARARLGARPRAPL